MTARGHGLILARAGMLAALVIAALAARTAPAAWLAAVVALTCLYEGDAVTCRARSLRTGSRRGCWSAR
jgi:hypothetical protein